MNIILEDNSQTKKTLKVNVPADVVNAEKASICKEFAKSARIPGFRAGKAPQNIIEMRYKQEIESEILKKIAPQFYQKAMTDYKLKPVEEPIITDLSFEKDGQLNITTIIFTAPEVKLPEYKGIKLTKEEVKIEDSEIENVIKDMLERQATFEVDNSKPLAKDDFAIIDYEGFHDGESFEAKKDSFMCINEDSFIKDFCNQLIGLKTGDKKTVKVTLPPNYEKAELSGKDVEFEVLLKDIKKKKLPELNDEFAKQSGESESVADLKKNIKESLIKMKDSMADYDLQDQAVNYLLDNTDFEIPESMKEREKQQIIKNHSNPNVMENEKAKEEINKNAEKRVKTYFILNEIIQKENIVVEDADLDEKYAEIGSRFNASADQIKSFYAQDQEKIADLRYQVKHEKTLKFLTQNAEIKTVKKK